MGINDEHNKIIELAKRLFSNKIAKSMAEAHRMAANIITGVGEGEKLSSQQIEAETHLNKINDNSTQQTSENIKKEELQEKEPNTEHPKLNIGGQTTRQISSEDDSVPDELIKMPEKSQERSKNFQAEKQGTEESKLNEKTQETEKEKQTVNTQENIKENREQSSQQAAERREEEAGVTHTKQTRPNQQPAENEGQPQAMQDEEINPEQPQSNAGDNREYELQTQEKIQENRISRQEQEEVQTQDQSITDEDKENEIQIEKQTQENLQHNIMREEEQAEIQTQHQPITDENKVTGEKIDNELQTQEIQENRISRQEQEEIQTHKNTESEKETAINKNFNEKDYDLELNKKSDLKKGSEQPKTQEPIKEDGNHIAELTEVGKVSDNEKEENLPKERLKNNEITSKTNTSKTREEAAHLKQEIEVLKQRLEDLKNHPDEEKLSYLREMLGHIKKEVEDIERTKE